MKKAIIVLMAFTGCQQNKTASDIDNDQALIDEITTFKEVIKGVQVEINGIEYDINNAEKTTYIYDDNQSGQLVKADIKESNGREYTFNSEYNNVDDLITKYTIVHGEETSRLLVDLFEYD